MTFEDTFTQAIRLNPDIATTKGKLEDLRQRYHEAVTAADVGHLEAGLDGDTVADYRTAAAGYVHGGADGLGGGHPGARSLSSAAGARREGARNERPSLEGQRYRLGPGHQGG